MLTTVKKNQHLVTLVLILLLSSFLRLWQLDVTPDGFHADEASFYINALSIAKTGADEDGIKLPISLSSLIDPKPALYSYFQIPFIVLIKNQIFASRLPSVFMGIISIGVAYLLIKKLSDEKIALFSAFVLAISPWHIIASRGTQEVISSFLFLLSAMYFLILFLEEKKYSVFSLFAFFASSFLSMYFYHSAKVLLPLIIIGLLIFQLKKTAKFVKMSALIFVAVIFAGMLSFYVQESGSRFAAVGILNDKGPMQGLIEQIYTTREELPIFMVRAFYNKGQAYLTTVAREYLAYFSPEFLFLRGGRPHRYIVPDHGLLYLIELPLILLGLFYSIRNKRKELPLFLGLLLLAPIPATLTTLETPSIIRTFPMVIAFAYFTAIGIDFITKTKDKFVRYAIYIVIVGIYLWQVLYFNIQYHIQLKYDDPWYRNSPYTDIAKEVSSRINEYDEVQVTNDLRPLYAYFVMENLISINELQVNAHARDNETYSLGKFTFNRKVCDFGELKPGILYIAEKECRINNNNMSDLELVKTISYHDDVEVYELLQLAE